MNQIKLYITINVPDELLSDDYYSDTMVAIRESVDELVAHISEDAELEDLEIK